MQHILNNSMRPFRHIGMTGSGGGGGALEEGMTEMFYLTTYSTHFIYGYMASDIW